MRRSRPARKDHCHIGAANGQRSRKRAFARDGFGSGAVIDRISACAKLFR